MANNTDPRLQNQVIYSVYVRNHTPEGTFRTVIPDLDRIKSLGTDIVWFLPIHPIGEAGKKGSLGCPYANRDYRTVNPAYGTMEDFQALVDAIHARGMKCMIDVVYNHTSPDSTLVAEHPEFFYQKPDGKRGNKVGDWTDVVIWTMRITRFGTIRSNRCASGQGMLTASAATLPAPFRLSSGRLRARPSRPCIRA